MLNSCFFREAILPAVTNVTVRIETQSGPPYDYGGDGDSE